jgi:hypothetical protein
MSHFLLGWFIRARSVARANHLPSRCEYLPRLGLFYSSKARPSAFEAQSQHAIARVGGALSNQCLGLCRELI